MGSTILSMRFKPAILFLSIFFQEWRLEFLLFYFGEENGQVKLLYAKSR
jgi:hypothetical protein